MFRAVKLRFPNPNFLLPPQLGTLALVSQRLALAGWLVTSRGPPYPSRSPRAHPSGWTRTQGLSLRLLVSYKPLAALADSPTKCGPRLHHCARGQKRLPTSIPRSPAFHTCSPAARRDELPVCLVPALLPRRSGRTPAQ